MIRVLESHFKIDKHRLLKPNDVLTVEEGRKARALFK